MNLLFKIKHYLLLYFNRKLNYEVHNSKDFGIKYWVSGYSKNIETGKWDVENGIPLGLYTKKLKAPLAQRVHVSGLCEYCFALIEQGKKEKVKTVVDFLEVNITTGTILKSNLAYSYWKTYNENSSKEYYVHGMGQGQILSLLTRYSLNYKNENLPDLILKVSNSYLVDFINKNGFVYVDREHIFLEEYPKSQNLMKHVLNGWIYSILGLYDYLKYVELTGISDPAIEKKRDIYNRTLKTLAIKLKEYDLGFWSLYNLPKSYKNICSIHYQEQHIALLEALYLLTQDEVFKRYSQKFKKQYRNTLFRIYSLFIKVFISNILKYKRIYRR
ncbi:D-glucuronyl C5-epimerase family protein [Flagellimonas sp. S3867]|uniref:D-glucuronyl C5-epimerase family protein n=1 Tax=Flagellimonas sp. S3867 TaxID=2768063 RepID=UPI001683C6BC|nr:D-glucuronyl C5-epimerase family protein [Flagellimonas sp. S3867]